MAYSLREAAAAVGKSKVTLWKSLQAGKISATRDANNEWRIEPAELHRVFPPVTLVPPETATETTPETAGNGDGNALLMQEIRHLKEKLADQERASDRECRRLSDQVADLQNERDRLLRVVEETAGSLKILTDQRQPKGWRGLWRRA